MQLAFLSSTLAIGCSDHQIATPEATEEDRAVKLIVIKDGERVGTGLWTREHLASGVIMKLTLNVNLGEKEVLSTLRREFTNENVERFTALARDVSQSSGTESVLATAEISERGEVEYQFSTKDGPVRTEAIAPPSGSIADPSIDWFVKTVPSLNAAERFYAFNLESKRWVYVLATHVGPTSIMIDGQRFSGHEIKYEWDAELYTAIVDDAGVPLRISTGMYVLEREPEFRGEPSAALSFVRDLAIDRVT